MDALFSFLTIVGGLVSVGLFLDIVLQPNLKLEKSNPQISEYLEICYQKIFHDFFGEKFLSKKYFIISAVTSITSVALIALYKKDNDISTIDQIVSIWGDSTMLILISCLVIANIFVDYFSIAQTQTFLKISSKCNSRKDLVIIAISDLFITASIFAMFFSFLSFSAIYVAHHLNHEYNLSNEPFEIKAMVYRSNILENGTYIYEISINGRYKNLEYTKGFSSSQRERNLLYIRGTSKDTFIDVNYAIKPTSLFIPRDVVFKLGDKHGFKDVDSIDAISDFYINNQSSTIGYSITYTGLTRPAILDYFSLKKLYQYIDGIKSAPISSMFAKTQPEDISNTQVNMLGFTPVNSDEIVCIGFDSEPFFYPIDPMNVVNEEEMRKIKQSCTYTIEDGAGTSYSALFPYTVHSKSIFERGIDFTIFFMSTFLMTLVFYSLVIGYYVTFKMIPGVIGNSEKLKEIISRSPYACSLFSAGIVIWGVYFVHQIVLS